MFIPQSPLSYLMAEGRRRASQVMRPLNAIVLETVLLLTSTGSLIQAGDETTALPARMSSWEQRLQLRGEAGCQGDRSRILERFVSKK